MVRNIVIQDGQSRFNSVCFVVATGNEKQFM